MYKKKGMEAYFLNGYLFFFEIEKINIIFFLSFSLFKTLFGKIYANIRFLIGLWFWPIGQVAFGLFLGVGAWLMHQLQ
jgi:hypothetical protein